MIRSKQFLLIGFCFSVITFTTTIICKNLYGITELNLIMNIMLENTYGAILIYGLIWSIVFLLHNYFINEKMNEEARYLGYAAFFLFFFNLLHDTITIIGALLYGL